MLSTGFVNAQTLGFAPLQEPLTHEVTVQEYSNQSPLPLSYHLLWSGADLAKKEIQEQKLHLTKIKVAVVDTGLAKDHPALRSLKARCYRWQGSTSKDKYAKMPCTDSEGHGSHVIGTIGGKKSLGLAFPTKIEFHVFDLSSVAFNQTDAPAFIEALDAQKVQILNLSIGEGGLEQVSVVGKMAQALNKSDVAIFMASGNSGRLQVESSLVTDLGSIFQVGSLSPWGIASPFSQSSDQLGVLAYGESIVSAAAARAPLNGWIQSHEQGDLVPYSGTSMATALVSGAATLLLQVNPTLSRDQLYEIIRQSAFSVDRPSIEKNYYLGFDSSSKYQRQLNVYRAFRIAQRLQSNSLAWRNDLKAILSQLQDEGCALAQRQHDVTSAWKAYFLADKRCHTRRNLAKALSADMHLSEYPGIFLVSLRRFGSYDSVGTFQPLFQNDHDWKIFNKKLERTALWVRRRLDENYKYYPIRQPFEHEVLLEFGFESELERIYWNKIDEVLRSPYNPTWNDFLGGGRGDVSLAELLQKQASKPVSDGKLLWRLTYLRKTLENLKRIISQENHSENKWIHRWTLEELAKFPGLNSTTEPIWRSVTKNLDQPPYAKAFLEFRDVLSPTEASFDELEARRNYLAQPLTNFPEVNLEFPILLDRDPRSGEFDTFLFSLDFHRSLNVQAALVHDPNFKEYMGRILNWYDQLFNPNETVAAKAFVGKMAYAYQCFLEDISEVPFSLPKDLQKIHLSELSSCMYGDLDYVLSSWLGIESKPNSEQNPRTMFELETPQMFQFFDQLCRHVQVVFSSEKLVEKATTAQDLKDFLLLFGMIYPEEMFLKNMSSILLSLTKMPESEWEQGISLIFLFFDRMLKDYTQEEKFVALIKAMPTIMNPIGMTIQEQRAAKELEALIARNFGKRGLPDHLLQMYRKTIQASQHHKTFEWLRNPGDR